MLEQGVIALVTFLVVIDPLGVAAVFAALTEGEDARWRRRMAVKAVAVAAVILLGFALLGGPLLAAMNVSLDAFRLAGGVLLFLIALEMVFERRPRRRERHAKAAQAERAGAHPDSEGPEDISVFPLGLPLLAGPGAIATTLLMMTNATLTPAQKIVSLAAAGLVLLLCLAAFFAAARLMRMIGPTASHAISRVLGVILAALAAQFILDALRHTISASLG
jgi:multiple antibiotic resistance protein